VILKACELNPPATQERIADQIRRYVKGNSIIYLPPLFIGLSVTPYSTASYLRTRVLDFFKSPRPMVLAIKAFFEIFQAYPVLKYLTKEQIEARLNPPKECSSKKEKLQLLASVSKTFESSTRLKSISKALSQPAALCFHDSLERCFMGRIELVMT
jgi:vesicle coat complex subunit